MTAPSPHGARHFHHHGDDSLVGRAWTRDEAIAALDDPERTKTEDPAEVWAHAGLRAGETFAEVGAGTGFYSLPAARKVGPAGHVYAIDLSPELVGLLRERAAADGLPQLEAVLATVDAIPLPGGVADLVLLANVLHDVRDATVAEAVRLIRPGGRLVNLDWLPVPTPRGPPAEVRLTPDQAARRLGNFGLVTADSWPVGPWHYAAVFRRPAAGAP